MAGVWFTDGIAAATIDADPRVHALRNTIFGPRPWCGAGPVTTYLDEKFAITASSCQTCADLVVALLPNQREGDG